MKGIWEYTKPLKLICDNGSEFISKELKHLIKQFNVQISYAEVNDQHKMGLIDRLSRTIREKINKYMLMHNTSRYIDVLPDIIHSYNNSFHTSIKMKPNEVKEVDNKINFINNNKYNKALQEETIFNVGDTVIFITNKKLFEQGSNAHWTKQTHVIVSKSAHSYTLDNGQIKKYYDLQLINDVQKLNKQPSTRSRDVFRKENRTTRRIQSEGIDLENILTGKRR